MGLLIPLVLARQLFHRNAALQVLREELETAYEAQGGRLLALSGTPVEKRQGELWSIVEF